MPRVYALRSALAIGQWHAYLALMLNYITEGDPALPRLIIAHGLFGQARNWGIIARALSDIRHVVLVDMRNHGDSPWFDSHSYEDMAADLAQVIGDDPVDLLGHSMGGKAAMVTALLHPEMIRRLVVADIAPIPYAHDQMQHIRAMQSLDLGQITRRQQAAKALDTTPEVAGFLTQNLDLAHKRWMINLDVLARDMPRILDFPDLGRRFDGPALFLSGGNSDYVTREHRGAIKALFPNARMAKIPGAGHWLHADRPDAVEAAIRAFLMA